MDMLTDDSIHGFAPGAERAAAAAIANAGRRAGATDPVIRDALDVLFGRVQS